MLVFKVRSNVNTMNHLLNDLLMHRCAFVALPSILPCSFLLVNFYTVRKETALVLRTEPFKQRYRVFRGFCTNELGCMLVSFAIHRRERIRTYLVKESYAYERLRDSADNGY